jgi:hypothetical protein
MERNDIIQEKLNVENIKNINNIMAKIVTLPCYGDAVYGRTFMFALRRRLLNERFVCAAAPALPSIATNAAILNFFTVLFLFFIFRNFTAQR